ncbi:Low-affinity inorganic phosphate transporter 1 [Acaryochloris thomasi RCC1774]|uniref:Phosphate transporter n=1 Tax=Acaryochloris thomasi RCC1774 TaxID=1764569 RepID=A0A2W1JP45_9CYAN|nr:inorganic phosphate transporter [Acaryochloris thomasi]PZD75110.1 Low-affinity inorganic phosphate transporter 1 [Acaryochloris thomasi RCC1774]
MTFLILVSGLALFLAWNLGANDVANAMGTSVGSKALTLRQAIVLAGVLEFSGAVLFGRQVIATLMRGVVDLELFRPQPQLLLLGMVSVLLTCGLWLQVATWQGWPVASSHATVGAIAGMSCTAFGIRTVHWSVIGLISLTWILTPLLSGLMAALFYSVVKRNLLEHPHRLEEWLPWLSVVAWLIVGAVVLPQFSALTQGVPGGTLTVALVGAVIFTLYQWSRVDQDPEAAVEPRMGTFQVLSACMVAFAHGSNDVGNAVAPLVAIATLYTTGSIPSGDLSAPLWILILGGIGITAGLAISGRKVISTVGEQIIPLQTSSGFSAELATATTVLLSSRFGLPVSTTHALIGGVVGIGLVQDWRTIQLTTLRQIALAWLITIPISISLSALIFLGLQRLPL